MSSFAAAALPCCLPNKTSIINFVGNNYPAVSTVIVGIGLTDVMDAVEARRRPLARSHTLAAASTPQPRPRHSLCCRRRDVQAD